MKSIKLIIALFLFSFATQAQRINKIFIKEKGASIVTSFLLSENVVIQVAQDGSIASWGVDKYSDRGTDYIQRPLEAFTGRIEYYTEKENEAFRGKIKYIGNTIYNLQEFHSLIVSKDSYSAFADSIEKWKTVLARLRDRIDSVRPFEPSFMKIGEIGTLLGCYYDIHSDPEFAEALLYSFS
jgi:alpha-tubulin suppressor-like RCC1 family protein